LTSNLGIKASGVIFSPLPRICIVNWKKALDRKNNDGSSGEFQCYPYPKSFGQNLHLSGGQELILSIRSQVTSTVWIVKFLYRKCCRKGTRLKMKALMTVSLADTGSRISFPATGADVLLQRYNLVVGLQFSVHCFHRTRVEVNLKRAADFQGQHFA
jgi:hypothetical protein